MRSGGNVDRTHVGSKGRSYYHRQPGSKDRNSIIVNVGILTLFITLVVWTFYQFQHEQNEPEHLLLFNEEDMQSAKEGDNVDTSLSKTSPTLSTEIKNMVKNVMMNRANNDFVGLENVGPMIREQTKYKLDVSNIYGRMVTPVLGEYSSNGSQPLFGFKHKGSLYR